MLQRTLAFVAGARAALGERATAQILYMDDRLPATASDSALSTSKRRIRDARPARSEMSESFPDALVPRDHLPVVFLHTKASRTIAGELTPGQSCRQVEIRNAIHTARVSLAKWAPRRLRYTFVNAGPFPFANKIDTESPTLQHNPGAPRSTGAHTCRSPNRCARNLPGHSACKLVSGSTRPQKQTEHSA